MCTCSQHSATTASPAAANAATFAIEDMTCSHCAGTIRSALKEAMPGAAVVIDIDLRQVTVDGDPDAAAAVIREAGYEPRILVR